MTISNNPPDVLVALTKEQAEFMVKNCDANILMGLQALQDEVVSSEDLIRKMVENIEMFRSLKNAVNSSMKEGA